MSQTETKRKVKIPRRTPQAPDAAVEIELKRATCGLCGESSTSDDWRQIAAWFSAHLQQSHPEEFGRLFGVSAAMLTWLISQCYETEPDWNKEEAMVVLRKELGEIIGGARDPLVDGIS